VKLQGRMDDCIRCLDTSGVSISRSSEERVCQDTPDFPSRRQPVGPCVCGTCMQGPQANFIGSSDASLDREDRNKQL
jgi:hypothetical protein